MFLERIKSRKDLDVGWPYLNTIFRQWKLTEGKNNLETSGNSSKGLEVANNINALLWEVLAPVSCAVVQLSFFYASPVAEKQHDIILQVIVLQIIQEEQSCSKSHLSHHNSVSRKQK